MTAAVVEVLLEGLGPRATQQLGLLLAVAVRDASYDVDPAVRAFVRDLRAWSFASTQPKVFRDTLAPGVPDRAPVPVAEALSAREVDIAEAATRTGLSEGVLRRYARDGRYGARRGRSGWLLDAAEVAAVAAARGR